MDDLDLYVQLNGVELLEQIEEDTEIVLQRSDFIDPFESKYLYYIFIFNLFNRYIEKSNPLLYLL